MFVIELTPLDIMEIYAAREAVDTAAARAVFEGNPARPARGRLVRGEPAAASGRCRPPVDRMDTVHLSVQPDPTAPDQRALRFTAAGLPVGLQIIGPRHADRRLVAPDPG